MAEEEERKLWLYVVYDIIIMEVNKIAKKEFGRQGTSPV